MIGVWCRHRQRCQLLPLPVKRASGADAIFTAAPFAAPLAAIEHGRRHAKVDQSTWVAAAIAVFHVTALATGSHRAAGQRQLRCFPAQESMITELTRELARIDTPINRNGLKRTRCRWHRLYRRCCATQPRQQTIKHGLSGRLSHISPDLSPDDEIVPHTHQG